MSLCDFSISVNFCRVLGMVLIYYWLICVALFDFKMLVQWRRTRQFPLTIGQSGSILSNCLEWGFVCLVIVWSVGVFSQRVPFYPVFGYAVLLIGLGFLVSALWFLGDSWRIGIDDRAPGALVTTGIFAYSRNPIFVFLLCWFWGVYLVLGTGFFLVCAVALSMGVSVQIRHEEVFLERFYGEVYRAYKKRVPRYFLFNFFE